VVCVVFDFYYIVLEHFSVSNGLLLNFSYFSLDEREKDGKEAQSGSVVAHSSVFKQLLSALQLGKLRFDPSLD